MVCRIGSALPNISAAKTTVTLGHSTINPETAPPPLTRPPANEGRFEAFDPLSPR